MRKFFGLLFFLALFLSPVGAQSLAKYDGVVIDQNGKPVIGATIRVCTSPATGQPCTPLANVFSDINGAFPAQNPVTTDFLGNFYFYVVSGVYELEFSGTGLTTKQVPDVTITLPQNIPNPVFTSLTATTADIGTLNGFVYVDGVINATISAAIAALPSTGGTVIIPCGTYSLSTTLLIPSNVVLEGCGMGSTTSGGTRLVAASGSVTPVVQVQGTSASARSTNIFLRDLTIQGVYTASQVCMQIDHATYIVQDHVQYVQCGQAEWDNDVYRSLHTDVSYYQSGSGGTNTTATVRVENISNPSVPTEQVFFNNCVWQGDPGSRQGTAVYFGPATEEERITTSKLDYSTTNPNFPIIYVNQAQIVDISNNTISGFSSVSPSPAVVYVTGNNPTRAFEVHVDNNTSISFSNAVPAILFDFATDYEVVGGSFQGPGSGTAIVTTSNTFGGNVGPFIMASVDTPVNDVSGLATVFYHSPSSATLIIKSPVTAGNINSILSVDGTRYATLQQALAACPSYGCTIWIPDNVNTTISSVLTITKPVHIIFGKNTITCTLADPGVGSGCINVLSDNVEIEGQDTGTLFTQNTGGNIQVGIQLNSQGNIKIHDMFFNWQDQTMTIAPPTNYYTCIRSVHGSHDLRFYNNTMTMGGNRGFDIRGANRVWLQNNYFFTTGYHVAGSTTGGIGNGSPASIDIDGTVNSTNAWCEGNEVEVAGDALACVGIGIHMNHNTIHGAADFGLTPMSTEAAIDVSRSQDVEVIGNHVINGAGPQLSTQSIAVVGGPSGLGSGYQIEGNTFIVNTTCCGIAASDPRVLVGSIAGGGLTSGQPNKYGFINNTLNGVRVTSDTVNGLTITGNRFHNIASSIASGIAIDLEQVSNGFGAVMANFVVSGNSFSTNNASLTTALNLGNGITTPDSCVITDNATGTEVTTDVFANTSFAYSTCVISRSNKTIGAYSNGLFSPVLPYTNGFTDTGTINFKRLRANQGTSLTAGNFVLSSGWGTAPSIPILFGQDSSFIIQITTGTGSPTADPFVTFTFADGAWPVAPSCTATRGDEFSPIAATWSITSLTTTQMVFVFVGTPVASTSYIANFTCIGR